MKFGLGRTRCGAAEPIFGGALFSKRAVECATKFLFVAAAAVMSGRLKNHKLRKTAFHISGLSCGLKQDQP
jgi:hypothetical protein